MVRWLTALITSLVVGLISYVWAIPLCGAWLGVKFLPPDKQGTFTAELMLLAVGASLLISLMPRATTMFTVMSGGTGVGAIIVLSLAINVNRQPLPPQYVQMGGMIGAFIGFSLAVGAAMATLMLKLILEWWLLPKLKAEEPADAGAEAAPSPRRQAQRTRPRKSSPVLKIAMVLMAGIVLIPIMKKVNLPMFGKPSHNPNYRLTPSVWKGSITYKGQDYPFTLVFEQVDPAGQLLGYMDWEGQYRLVVEGKAGGNHLVFDDTDFIIGDPRNGSFDKKDVWISGDRMVGTDKNGTATLQARKTSSSPPLPDAKTAVGYRANKQALAATWSKHVRVCEDVQTLDQHR